MRPGVRRGRPFSAPLAAALALLLRGAAGALGGAAVADPWAALGLEAGADDGAVSEAFRRLAREHHPDKGGDGERFIEVRAAYEQLTTRRAYWETVGARQSGDGDDAGGTYSQAWEQAKLRVRLKFEGGELVMPAEEYLRADSADASDVLRQAFDGKKVSFKILNADGQEVMSGERDAVVKRRERLPSSGEEGASSSAIVGDIGESDGGDANSPADSPPLPPAWAAQAVQLTLGLDAAELEELLEAVRELRTQGSGSDADSSGGAGALASALTSSRDVWALLAARVDAARVAGLLAASAAFVAAALFTFT